MSYLILISSWFFIFVVTHPVTAQDKTTYSLGIVPQQAASKLARKWVPLCKMISSASGSKVVFKTAPNIPTFEERLKKGEYDFSYMNPYHYTVFAAAPGYRVFAKARDKKIKGIVVAKKGAIKELSELSGRTLAFPSPAAFAASILPRSELKKRQVAFTPKYVSSHDSVYKSVAKGLFPAGGGVMRTFRNVDQAVQDQLEIIWTTSGYTPHALAVHPRVPKQVWRAVQTAFTALDKSPSGAKIVGALNLKGFEVAKDSDWDDVRALDINLSL